MTTSQPPAAVPGLPTLAGLGSLAQATVRGLSVDATVTRLKRLHAVARAAHGVLVARITAEPQYELKMLYSHHAWLLAELVSAIRGRVGEMREPPLGLEDLATAGTAARLRRDRRVAPTARTCAPASTRACCRARRCLCGIARRDESAGRRPDAIPAAPCAPRAVRALSTGQQAAQALAERRTSPRPAWLDIAARGAGGGAAAWTAPPLTRRPARRRGSRRRHGRSTRCRAATSASRTCTTRASTPRRSSTTRRSRPAEDADDALQAAPRDRRAGDDGQHHRRDARASRGATTAT